MLEALEGFYGRNGECLSTSGQNADLLLAEERIASE
jgi:hypothetical protein